MSEERRLKSLECTTISARIPLDLLPYIEKARKMTGALSNSEVVRKALELYLKELTLLGERKTAVLEGRL